MNWWKSLTKNEWNYQALANDELLEELKKFNPNFSEAGLKDEVGRILQTIKESDFPSQQKEVDR